MKSNQNDQLNRGKTGDRPNQKPQEVAGKKEANANGHSEKKGKQSTAAQEPKELDEETTSEETTEEEETEKPSGKKKSR